MLAQQYAGLSLRQIGQRMGGLHYAAQSRGLRRLVAQRQRDGKLPRGWNAPVEMLNV